jgi:16S rRNA (cytosine1402-N4)-methyltransferase
VTRPDVPAPTHIPVLLTEVVAGLNPKDGARYIDGTFGLGGYTKALLSAADCRVFAIDRDPQALVRGGELAEASQDQLLLIEGLFGDMDRLARDHGAETVDGVALDLGVSSPQLDQAERGFSFRQDGPLDMRMSTEGLSAADVVNDESEEDLANIIYTFGEERHSRRIAKAIVTARTMGTITRTGQLADLVRGVVPRPRKPDAIDPATRTFQAIRIYVNDELGEIDRGLSAAERVLAPGGRLAVVSFHSLEDRRIKNFLRERSGNIPRPSRHLPDNAPARAPTFRALTRRPTTAGPEELAQNPRSRSAKLRLAERTDAPAWHDAEEL